VTETARALVSRVDHYDGRCHRCVLSTLDNLDQIDFIYSSVAGRINKLAYHVLEA